MLRSLSVAEFQRVDARELQAAQPDVADAGAERLRDRQDARRCAVGRVMTVFSEPVSTTKSCASAPLTLARTTTLSFTSLKGP